jgi:Ca2+-transporting ATPase
MLWFFLGNGIVYAVVREGVDAITLVVAIAPLLLMDAVLHRRTSASVQSLKNRLATEAVVIRDEVSARIPAVDIVPGDIVLVAPAEMLPADGVFVAAGREQRKQRRPLR